MTAQTPEAERIVAEVKALAKEVGKELDKKPTSVMNPGWQEREDQGLRLEILKTMGRSLCEWTDQPYDALERIFQWVKTGEIRKADS